MENKAKNLELSLERLLSNQSKIKELSDYGLLAEYKRLYLAVKYMNTNGIETINGRALDALSSAIGYSSITSAEFKLATSCAELAILDAFKAASYNLDRFGGDTRSEIKISERKKKEIIDVAGQILPDALNRIYDILQDYGRDGKIYDASGNVVFDFESFIDKINKAAHTTSVVNNLPSISVDAAIKYRKVVQENASKFLNMVPIITKNLSTVVETGSVRPTFEVNTYVRRLRRANRPVDKNGNTLPSYLDFVNDDGTIVSYSRFLNTPTAKALKEFRNENEYVNYVSSTGFWSYVSYLESPMSSEAVEVGLPSFGLNELPVSDGVDVFDTRRFPKEKLVLPKDVYKTANRSSNVTTSVTRAKDDKFVKGLNRTVAGILAVAILGNAVAYPVGEMVKAIKNYTPVVDPGVRPSGPSDDVINPPEVTTPSVDVEKVNPDEIIDNPAENIVPPEETTTPEELPTPPVIEETTPGEADDPEAPVPGHNDIDEDRREESTDNSFWFE